MTHYSPLTILHILIKTIRLIPSKPVILAHVTFTNRRTKNGYRA